MRGGLIEPVGLKRNRVGKEKEPREAGRARRLQRNKGETRKTKTKETRLCVLHPFDSLLLFDLQEGLFL